MEIYFIIEDDQIVTGYFNPDTMEFNFPHYKGSEFEKSTRCELEHYNFNKSVFYTFKAAEKALKNIILERSILKIKINLADELLLVPRL